MCFNPLKAAPYALGGLVGGSLIKAATKSKSGSSTGMSPGATVTQGTPGPSPYGG